MVVLVELLLRRRAGAVPGIRVAVTGRERRVSLLHRPAYPRSSLNPPYGVTNALVPNWKRRPPEPSVPAPTVSYPIASRNRVMAAFAAGSFPAIGRALRSIAPAGRDQRAEVP